MPIRGSAKRIGRPIKKLTPAPGPAGSRRGRAGATNCLVIRPPFSKLWSCPQHITTPSFVAPGPGYNLPNNGSVYDFRRVLRHEFGHALGLDHPDETTPPQQVTAIMNSTTGDIEFLQPDDKLGMVTLYTLTDTGSTTPDSGTAGNVSTAAQSGGGGAEIGWGILLLGAWRRVTRRFYRDG